jgi:hypothetical protein
LHLSRIEKGGTFIDEHEEPILYKAVQVELSRFLEELAAVYLPFLTPTEFEYEEITNDVMMMMMMTLRLMPSLKRYASPPPPFFLLGCCCGLMRFLFLPRFLCWCVCVNYMPLHAIGGVTR